MAANWDPPWKIWVGPPHHSLLAKPGEQFSFSRMFYFCNCQIFFNCLFTFSIFFLREICRKSRFCARNGKYPKERYFRHSLSDLGTPLFLSQIIMSNCFVSQKQRNKSRKIINFGRSEWQLHAKRIWFLWFCGETFQNVHVRSNPKSLFLDFCEVKQKLCFPKLFSSIKSTYRVKQLCSKMEISVFCWNLYAIFFIL